MTSILWVLSGAVQIDVDRATAFDEMRTDVETGKFTHLSNSLVIAPFDNVKQALFFIPW
jgi:hypothetical protein